MKNKRIWFVSLLIVILFLLWVDLRVLWDETVFYVFQSRDLSRALELLKGRMIWFGPETTGGGNLPGPLYYFLLAPALAVGQSWVAAWWWMVALAAVAALVMWLALTKSGYQWAPWLWLGLFSLSAKTEHFLSIFINPSYLFVFAVCAVLFLWRSMSVGETPVRRQKYLMAAALAIALGAQIHFSIVFLWLGFHWHFFFDKAFQQTIGWKNLAKSWILFVVPFLPYINWWRFHRQGVDLGQPSVYVGNSDDIGPTLLHLLRAISRIDAFDLWFVFIHQSFKIIPVAAILIALAFALGKALGARIEPTEAPLLSPGLKRLIFFAFIPFSYIFVVPIANRYGMGFMIAVFLATCLAFERLLNHSRLLNIYLKLNIFAAAAMGYLILNRNMGHISWVSWPLFLGAALIVLFLVKRDRSEIGANRKVWALLLTFLCAFLQRGLFQSQPGEFIRANMLTNRQWSDISRQIYTQTGWSIDELKRRIYFVNSHIDADPELVYTRVTKKLPAPEVKDVPDGFFVVVNAPIARDLIPWLMKAPIADDIKEAIDAGDLVLDVPREKNRYQVIPYRVISTERVPKQFHNWGLYYNTAPERAELNSIAGARGWKSVGSNQILFKWNDCPDQNAYCDVGMRLMFARSTLEQDPDSIHLRVVILGEPLSQVSPWIHPSWTAAWLKPYVKFKCGSVEHEWILAQSVGYRRRYLNIQTRTAYFISNNSLIAPFHQEKVFPCKGEPHSIEAGHHGLLIDNIRTSRRMAASRIKAE